jgi:hypothetical protein
LHWLASNDDVLIGRKRRLGFWEVAVSLTVSCQYGLAEGLLSAAFMWYYTKYASVLP